SGSTLLHQALSAPSGAPPEHAVESIRLLVSAGADIDAPDANGAGKTVLELAAERNLSEVVAAVCELGARIDPHPDRQSSESAASLACVNGNTDLARSLVKRGAQVSLSIAAAIGDIDTLEAMLDDAGRLSRLTATVETAQKIRQELALPFMFACTNGQLESAFFLIRRGADVNLACAAAGTEVSASGLHWAARHGHFELVKFLINYGADLRAVDGTMKQTASQWAKEANFDRIHDYIEHLKKRG
ncbi:MAG: ankyrin repeat domain-containing protein, partial [Cyanobacteria bacterium]|nr:ankyrin repeat domain-containing protein [Cyanobacteriota bacterium]